MVVFGSNVLLFSDKHCQFPQHSDLKVSWSRWYRRAIERSAKQLSGAEKFIKEYPSRVFLDKDCRARLPIALPDPRRARYFLLAVTRGSYETAERYWNGQSSGSLMLDSSIVAEDHYANPFRVGFPLENRRFVHVLDEMTVDVLLQELDTVPDLIGYLECKEEFLTQTGLHVSAAGEEQLLARYMCTLRDGKHALPKIPHGTGAVALVEGDWEFYSVSPQREAKRAADAGSYMWDDLIEYQSSFIRAGTATTVAGLTEQETDHERVVRALADETRFSRRQLAAHFRFALTQSQPGRKFARVVASADRANRAYVFLTAPKPSEVTYEEYRKMRSDTLLTYCTGVKLRIPDIVEAVGIASEPFSESVSSQDFVYVDLTEDLAAEHRERLSEMMKELEVLQSPLIKPIKGQDHEFPMPFNFETGPEFFSAHNGIPMNRAARRAMAKRARGKRR